MLILNDEKLIDVMILKVPFDRGYKLGTTINQQKASERG